MTRRWSLAAAFLLTVVCGFLIVAFGSSTGVFAWAERGGQSAGAVQPQSGQPAADETVTGAAIPVGDDASGDDGSSDTPRRDDDEDHDDGERDEREHEEDDRD